MSRILAVLRQRPWLAAGLAAVVIGAAVLVAVGALPGSPSPSTSARDRRWQQDIAYLARELPLDHVSGLTGVSKTVWNAAASRLEAQVPHLTGDQVIAGLLRQVALLHDDETTLPLPWPSLYPVRMIWLGRGLYVALAPAADRALLGARLEAVDGHPVSDVIAHLAPEIDHEDPGLARDVEASDLGSPRLLHATGLAGSATTVTLTVRTAAGFTRYLVLTALAGSRSAITLPLARVPQTFAQSSPGLPYWMRVMPGRRAVYLKYNQCLSGDGFQKLAARSLAVLRAHKSYRLIVDLRDNPGGNSAPFQALISGIRADPAINRRGRIFGLINGGTDSSATLDASSLGEDTRALLIGQQVEDPIDQFGDDSSFLTLPNSHLRVYYTTAVINGARTPLGTPDIVIAPTVAQILAGTDPVLDRALSYPLPS